MNPADSTPAAPPLGWPDFIGTLLVPLWIMIYPHPYGLALSIAAIVPALCFMRITARQIRMGPYKPALSDFDVRFYAAGAAMVLALGVRTLFDLRLVEWSSFAITVMLSAALLALVTTLCNRLRGVNGFEVLMFVMYCAGTAGLANAHLDTSRPRYVQGTVTSIWSKGSGRGYREYYRIAPYLDSEENIVELGPFDTLGVVKGDPVCGVLHEGRFGFPWYEIHMARCGATSNQAGK